MTSGTPALGELLSFFSGATNNEHCLMTSPDDIYDVPSKVCPPPPAGEQAICGVISGVARSDAAGKSHSHSHTCTHTGEQAVYGVISGMASTQAAGKLQTHAHTHTHVDTYR